MTNREKMNNLILVGGDGRNVGKTFLACKIIESLSDQFPVTAIKISPHWHQLDSNADIVEQGPGYVVCREKAISQKDSSLMMQKGAQEVFYIMADSYGLTSAFNNRIRKIKNRIIIAESAALHQLVEPGLFFFVKKKDEQIKKKEYLDFNPRIIENNWDQFDPDPFKIIDDYLKTQTRNHVLQTPGSN